MPNMNDANTGADRFVKLNEESIQSYVEHDHDTNIIIVKQKRTQLVMKDDGVEEEKVVEAFMLSASRALAFCNDIMAHASHLLGPEYNFNEEFPEDENPL